MENKKTYNRSLYYKKWKEKNPLRYAYSTLRNNAKRRKKEFTITFEYFKKFAVKVKYLDRKGIYKDSYHIDRKEEDKGYVPENLQLLKNHENIKKYFKSYHDGKEMVFKTEIDKDPIKTDVPF